MHRGLQASDFEAVDLETVMAPSLDCEHDLVPAKRVLLLRRKLLVQSKSEDII
jgi:hypothetical protein